MSVDSYIFEADYLIKKVEPIATMMTSRVNPNALELTDTDVAIVSAAALCSLAFACLAIAQKMRDEG